MKTNIEAIDHLKTKKSDLENELKIYKEIQEV